VQHTNVKEAVMSKDREKKQNKSDDESEKEQGIPDEPIDVPDGDIPEEEVDYDAALTPIPVGYYRLRIIKAEYVVSKEKPNTKRKHMVRVEYEIVAAYNSKHESHVGSDIREFLVVTQAMAERVARFAQEAGVEAPRTASRARLEELASSIIGVEISARVEHETWNGQTRARIASYGGPPSPASPRKK
jgi:hypothetical protein